MPIVAPVSASKPSELTSSIVMASDDTLLGVDASYNTASQPSRFTAGAIQTFVLSSSFSASMAGVSSSYTVLSASYVQISSSFKTTSASFAGLSQSYTVVSASYNVISASYKATSASYVATSASFAADLDTKADSSGLSGANLPLIVFPTISYESTGKTVSNTDNGSMITHSGAASTYTFPNDLTAGWSSAFTCLSGTVSFSGAVGVKLLYPPSMTSSIKSGSMAGAFVVSASAGFRYIQLVGQLSGAV